MIRLREDGGVEVWRGGQLVLVLTRTEVAEIREPRSSLVESHLQRHRDLARGVSGG